jgi:serine protease
VARAAWTQAAARIALLAVFSAFVVRYIRRKGGAARPWRPGFLLSALLFGPGLLFFAPLLAPRVWLPLDILARPFAEWDMLASASVHRWLPLATFLVPLAMSAVAFSIPRMRPVIAGAALGTAAYLASQPLLGLMATTSRGLVILSVWALVNVFICLWLARLSLDEKPAT